MQLCWAKPSATPKNKRRSISHKWHFGGTDERVKRHCKLQHTTCVSSEDPGDALRPVGSVGFVAWPWSALFWSGWGWAVCVCVERWGIWGNWGLGFTCAFMYRLQHFTLQLLCCQDVVPVRTSKPSVNLPLWWRQVVHKTQGTMW